MTDTSDFGFASNELAFNVDSFGKIVTIKQKTSGTYDASIGKAVVTPTLYTAAGIFAGYKDYNVDGTMVQRGDRRIILAKGSLLWSPSFYMPVAGDIILSGSSSWNVIDTNEIELQGDKIGFVVQVRGMKVG